MGFADAPERGGIRCIGTAFLVKFDGFATLVTAAHVARQFGSDPFVVRFNRRDGSSVVQHAEGVPWVFNPDSAVDIAVLPFTPLKHTDIAAIDESTFADEERCSKFDVGIGDNVYTVGLYAPLPGSRRNFPLIHAGTVAAMAGEEKIPVRDWNDPSRKKTALIDAHIIQSVSLGGLSGSPVFVRPSADIDQLALADGEEVGASRVPLNNVYLFGILQGAWDAPPDERLAIETGRGVTVPVGMSVVTPVQQLIETLELPQMKKMRDDIRAKQKEREFKSAATPMSVSDLDEKKGDALLKRMLDTPPKKN